jgi:hypothetical protein
MTCTAAPQRRHGERAKIRAVDKLLFAAVQHGKRDAWQTTPLRSDQDKHKKRLTLSERARERRWLALTC